MNIAHKLGDVQMNHLLSISHQPLRCPFFRIRMPLSTSTEVMRFTVEADFFMILAISVCLIC